MRWRVCTIRYLVLTFAPRLNVVCQAPTLAPALPTEGHYVIGTWELQGEDTTSAEDEDFVSAFRFALRAVIDGRAQRAIITNVEDGSGGRGESRRRLSGSGSEAGLNPLLPFLQSASSPSTSSLSTASVEVSFLVDGFTSSAAATQAAADLRQSFENGWFLSRVWDFLYSFTDPSAGTEQPAAWATLSFTVTAVLEGGHRSGSEESITATTIALIAAAVLGGILLVATASFCHHRRLDVKYHTRKARTKVHPTLGGRPDKLVVVTSPHHSDILIKESVLRALADEEESSEDLL